MGNKNGAATNAPEDSNNNNPEVKTETAENLPLTRCTSNSRQKGGSSSKARKAASNSFRKEQDRRNGEENDDGDGRSYKRRRIDIAHVPINPPYAVGQNHNQKIPHKERHRETDHKLRECISPKHCGATTIFGNNPRTKQRTVHKDILTAECNCLVQQKDGCCCCKHAEPDKSLPILTNLPNHLDHTTQGTGCVRTKSCNVLRRSCNVDGDIYISSDYQTTYFDEEPHPIINAPPYNRKQTIFYQSLDMPGQLHLLDTHLCRHQCNIYEHSQPVIPIVKRNTVVCSNLLPNPQEKTFFNNIKNLNFQRNKPPNLQRNPQRNTYEKNYESIQMSKIKQVTDGQKEEEGGLSIKIKTEPLDSLEEQHTEAVPEQDNTQHSIQNLQPPRQSNKRNKQTYCYGRKTPNTQHISTKRSLKTLEYTPLQIASISTKTQEDNSSLKGLRPEHPASHKTHSKSKETQNNLVPWIGNLENKNSKKDTEHSLDTQVYLHATINDSLILTNNTTDTSNKVVNDHGTLEPLVNDGTSSGANSQSIIDLTM